MTPPPAQELIPRLFIGPALRSQPDKRLVGLVRSGYEAAFEEIVRRYGAALRRYAAAIVDGRAEDVTQDAFSKALLALRHDDADVELRPWLYRIVRNTALNELRDRPPSAQELDDAIGGGTSVGEEAERRAEVAELMTRLRALPEPQRAAIVMRELEGLSHEEIAAALGVSGGAARQAIHRARTALRDAVGLAIPLPLLRMLIDHGGEAALAGAGGGAAAAGASLGGAGASGALKVGVATALIAGSVGTGVALEQGPEGRTGLSRDAAGPTRLAGSAEGGGAAGSRGGGSSNSGSGGGESSSRGGSDRSGRDDGPGRAGGDDDEREGRDGRDVFDSSGPSDRSGPGGGDDLDDSSGSRSGSNSGSGSGDLEDEVLEDSSGSGGGTSGSGSSGSSGSDGGGSGSNSGSGPGETQIVTESSSGPSEDSSGSGSGSGDGDELDLDLDD